MTFQIGSYTFESEKIYKAFIDAGITNDETIKKFDKNSNKTITDEEALLAVEISDDEEENETTNGSTSSDGTLSESELSALATYEKQLSTYASQRQQLLSQYAKAKEVEDVEEINSQITSLNNQIRQTRTSIFNLLYKAEEKALEAQNKANTANGVSGSNYISGSPTGFTGVSNTSSGTANYALQFDGKGASEMSQIMRSAGCRFDEGAWCADFVTFATKMANGGSTPYDLATTCSNTAGCTSIGNWAQQRGLYTNDLSKVQPGDFILYGGRGSEYHIGIVTSVNSDGTVNTIEGNTSDDNGNYTNGVVNQHSHVSSFGGFVIMH